jgi:ribosomal protein L21E
VESGQADPASVKGTPAIPLAVARELLFRTPREERDIALTPRFHVGDRVRGRNIHPTTHTRMPRYTRGRTGVVDRMRGVFNLPDREHGAGEPKPQHVYLIRFTARKLWGDDAPAHDALYIDMWEDYLEPA